MIVMPPSKPTIYYFPLRGTRCDATIECTVIRAQSGRGEYLKLALAAADVDFDVQPVDYATMKKDTVAFPFGQCPWYAHHTL